MPRSRQRALARARTRQRQRRLAALGVLLVALALIGADLLHGGPFGGHPTATVVRSRAATDSGSPQAVPQAVPQSGPGTFAWAAGTGPVIGTAGQLRRFRVAVENGSGQDPAAFATVTAQTLSDPRGWTAGGDVRFQQVPQNSTSEFTVYLATPATSEKMCAAGGIHTDQSVSCRLPGQIVINLARWLTAIPEYGASLAAYQQFELNHQIGRELGHGNESCSGPGLLAPVMQQQTLGLKGCVANAWPYINGQRYAGAAIP